MKTGFGLSPNPVFLLNYKYYKNNINGKNI